MTSNKLFDVLIPILKLDLLFDLVEMAPKVDAPKRLVIVFLIQKVGENALGFVHQHPMISTPMHLIFSLVLPWPKTCCMKWKAYFGFHYLPPLIFDQLQWMLPRIPPTPFHDYKKIILVTTISRGHLCAITLYGICIQVGRQTIFVILGLAWWWCTFLCHHTRDKCIQMCKPCLEVLTYPWFAFGVESSMKTFFPLMCLALLRPCLVLMDLDWPNCTSRCN